VESQATTASTRSARAKMTSSMTDASPRLYEPINIELIYVDLEAGGLLWNKSLPFQASCR
jgi:hypothetical protein